MITQDQFFATGLVIICLLCLAIIIVSVKYFIAARQVRKEFETGESKDFQKRLKSFEDTRA